MNRRLPIAASVTLLAMLALASASARATTGLDRAHGFAPHQVVLKLSGGERAGTFRLKRGADVRTVVAALREDPRVEYAAPNFIATASAKSSVDEPEVPNDPGPITGAPGPPGGWVSKQWNFLPWQGEPTPLLPVSPGGIDAIGAWENLAAVGRPGAQGVTVAVLDTGIAYRTLSPHFLRSPDFATGQFVKGYDFVDDDALPLDENGHGTHVAGTIAEKTNNGIGLTGLAFRAKLMPVRVLDELGRGRADDIAKGIRFAVAHDADVINMSFNFGCSRQVPGVDEALRQAYRRGIVAVASVGNVGSEACVSPPATGPHAIGVGGSTEGGCIGGYSLAGKGVRRARPRRRHAGDRLSLRPGRGDLPGDAERPQHHRVQRAEQLRRHLDGRGPRLGCRGDGPRRRRRRPQGEEEGQGRRSGDEAPAADGPRPRPPGDAPGRRADRRGSRHLCRPLTPFWPSRSRTQEAPRALHASDRGRRYAPVSRRQVVRTIITLHGE